MTAELISRSRCIFFFSTLECLVDIIVTDENLHGVFLSLELID